MLDNAALGCTQDAKELLYSLFKAGFVGLQDVPRTADHAPSRTLYTWSVDNEAAADKLAAELYKAAFNVYVRCTNEFEQHKEVSHIVFLILCDRSLGFIILHNSLSPLGQTMIASFCLVSSEMQAKYCRQQSASKGVSSPS